MAETFLITGSMGCIGSWVIRNLVADGVRVLASDLRPHPVRPRLLMRDDELAGAELVALDVTDRAAVDRIVGDEGVTHIVHLAGLQIPFCQADPELGARVNVVGTINMLEAARHHGDTVEGFAYASSLAVMGPSELYRERPVPDDAVLAPTTLYGAYKQANERSARVYWDDWGVGSVGLRPYVVYGVARDQGMTADIAKAILAAAAGTPYRIRFGGDVALQYADDVARIFIAAARADHHGAAVCNLRNDVVAVEAFVGQVEAQVPGCELSFDDTVTLPYPADLDDRAIREILGDVPHTPLPDAIADSLRQYRELLERGAVDLAQLDP